VTERTGKVKFGNLFKRGPSRYDAWMEQARSQFQSGQYENAGRSLIEAWTVAEDKDKRDIAWEEQIRAKAFPKSSVPAVVQSTSLSNFEHADFSELVQKFRSSSDEQAAVTWVLDTIRGATKASQDQIDATEYQLLPLLKPLFRQRETYSDDALKQKLAEL